MAAGTEREEITDNIAFNKDKNVASKQDNSLSLELNPSSARPVLESNHEDSESDQENTVCSELEPSSAVPVLESDHENTVCSESVCPDPLLTIKSEIINEADTPVSSSTLPQDKIDSYSGGNIVKIGIKKTPYNMKEKPILTKKGNEFLPVRSKSPRDLDVVLLEKIDPSNVGSYNDIINDDTSVEMKRYFENKGLECNTRDYQRHMEKLARTNLKCTYCSFETLDQAILNAHVNEKHKDDLNQSQICNDVSSSMIELKKHNRDKNTKMRYKCEICDFDSAIKWYTEKHMERHEGHVFKCKLCDFTCKYSKKLRIHTRNNHLFKCKICNKTFKYEAFFHRHMKSQHLKNRKSAAVKRKLLKCDQCEFSCLQYTYFEDHKLTHSKDKPDTSNEENVSNGEENLSQRDQYENEMKLYQCDQCDTAFNSIKRLTHHLANVHKRETPFKCNICESSFRTSGYLKAHMAAHTEKNNSNLCNSPLKIKHSLTKHIMNRGHSKKVPFKCEQCKFGCKTAARLRAHTTTVHSDSRPFKCKVCRASFKQMNNLKIHLQRSHSKERPFICDLCEYSSKYKYGIRQHMKIHSDEKPHHCNVCDYSCKHSGNLKIHKRIHSEEKQFQCKKCDYSCKHSSALTRHMLGHANKKKKKSHRCKLCEYTCRYPSTLRSHMLVHTEERPYQCKLCEYTSKHSGSLRIHMRVHTEERPYQCKLCEYTSKHSGSLRTHMLVHTEERPYQCELCEYTCRQSGNLKIHMLVHTEERPYQCKLCEYSCKQAYYLKRHMSVHTAT